MVNIRAIITHIYEQKITICIFFILGKCKVFKNTTIAFFPYLSHRDPKVYPDAEKFEPERFLNSESKKTWSFIPFAEGTRSCIGKLITIC